MQDRRLIEIFLELTAIDAMSQNERPVADYITAFLTRLGFSPKEDNTREITGSNTGNLICPIGTGGNFALLSHMDTVRPTKDLKHVVTDEKITTSGNTILGGDDRAGITAILYAVEKAVKEKAQLNDFTVAFTVCEETTMLGSLSIQLPDYIKGGIIFDSQYRPGKFIFAACGAKYFNVKIIGKASHAGISPEKGINSIAAASAIISNIKQGRIDDETTVNIGTISGGEATNVISPLTVFDGEVRSFDKAKVDNVLDEIKSTVSRISGEMKAQYVIEDRWDFEPFVLPKTSPVYIKINNAIINAGLEAAPVTSLGGSDANALNARGIEAVNIGIGAQNPHADDEFILIEDLYKASEIASQLIRKQ